MSEKKTYVTTDRAGFVVAGRRVPAVYEKDAAGQPRARPSVGHPLDLTDAEAEYELAQGTIERAPSKKNEAEKAVQGA